MSGERGTLPRGAAPGTQDQAIWPAPTAPASRRLPAAPRERKPALAALALLLIIGGALGAAYLVVRSGQRVAAIEITSPVGAGQRIPVSAMHEVQIASDGGLSYVPWDQASQVARYYAAGPIPPGTLLSSAMVVRSSNLSAGKAVVGLALKDGQVPDGLGVGDHVNLYQVSDATQSCPGTPGGALATNAVVLAITAASPASGTSTTDVRVAVDPAAAGPVACNASNGVVGLAVMPAGSRTTRASAAVPGAAAATPSLPPARAARAARRRQAGATPSPSTRAG